LESTLETGDVNAYDMITVTFDAVTQMQYKEPDINNENSPEE